MKNNKIFYKIKIKNGSREIGKFGSYNLEDLLNRIKNLDPGFTFEWITGNGNFKIKF